MKKKNYTNGRWYPGKLTTREYFRCFRSSAIQPVPMIRGGGGGKENKKERKNGNDESVAAMYVLSAAISSFGEAKAIQEFRSDDDQRVDREAGCA